MLTLSTIDGDFTNVGHLYAITDGNYPFAFYIEPGTGGIIVAGILDHETKTEYNLTVSVSEQSISEVFLQDFTTVHIKILDSNDNPPVFQPKTYRRTLPENVTVGTQVRVVTCSDMDDGANAVPRFTITAGNIGDVFEVVSHPADADMGVVRVAGDVDREKMASYTLEITATDVGGLTGLESVFIGLEKTRNSCKTATFIRKSPSILIKHKTIETCSRRQETDEIMLFNFYHIYHIDVLLFFTRFNYNFYKVWYMIISSVPDDDCT